MAAKTAARRAASNCQEGGLEMMDDDVTSIDEGKGPCCERVRCCKSINAYATPRNHGDGDDGDDGDERLPR